MGNWQPTPAFYESVLSGDETAAEASRPYPFFLAHPLEAAIDTLGDPADWQAEWKWDGIRAQLLRRGGQTYLWSRGEELVTDRYPEVAARRRVPARRHRPGRRTAAVEGRRAFSRSRDLQKRIGRKTLGKKLLADVPVALPGLRPDRSSTGEDWRDRPLVERRQELERIVDRLAHPQSIVVAGRFVRNVGRTHRDAARVPVPPGRGVHAQAEGVAVPGRPDPRRLVEVEDRPAHDGRGADRRPDGATANGPACTRTTRSRVWDDGKLVTVAKAYSGLTDAEIRVVDAFIRANTLEKFGPVRTVKPELVFELGFEGIQASARHKSGIAVRFPRMLRQRTDKTAADADTLDAVKALSCRRRSRDWLADRGTPSGPRPGDAAGVVRARTGLDAVRVPARGVGHLSGTASQGLSPRPTRHREDLCRLPRPCPRGAVRSRKVARAAAASRPLAHAAAGA